MLGLILAAAATPGPATGTLSAYDIFGRARRYWEAQQYPGLVEYTIAVSVTQGGVVKVERYTSGYDGYTGTIRFDPVSDVEAAHPHVVSGINAGFLFWRIGKAEALADYLGVPILAPNYGFGIGRTRLTQAPRSPTPQEIVAQIRQEFHDPDPRATPSPAPSPSPALHEIADVFARNRTYDITLLGVEDVDGVPAYHLKLQPLLQPHRNRLRDLWVDRDTFAPHKLIEALNFENGAGTQVPWSVTFASHDGALYIERESALGPMHYEGQAYSGASVTFENVRAVTALPRDLETFVPSDDADRVMEEP